MPKQNVRKFAEPILAPDFLRIDGQSVGGGGAEPAGTPTSTSGIEVTDNAAGYRRIDFALNTGPIELDGSDIFSLNLGTFGRNVVVVGVMSSNLSATKSGNFPANTDIDFGIGTVASDGNPLGGDEDIIVEKIDFNDNGLTQDLSFSVTSGISSTVVTEFPVAVASDDDIIVNIYASVAPGSFLALSGTISFFVLDLAVPA